MSISTQQFLRRILPLAAALLLLAQAAMAAPLHPGQVLVSGPVPAAAPAFHDAEKAGVDWKDLLAEMPLRPGTEAPAAGREFAGPAGSGVAWSSVRTDDGDLALDGGDGPSVRYLSFYVASDRWQKADLIVTGDVLVAGAVGGQGLSFSETAGEDGAPGSRKATLTLPAGKHEVVLRTLHRPDEDDDWKLGLALEPGEDAEEGALALTVSPQRNVDIHTILNAPRVSDVSISPDGEFAAIALGAYRNGDDREQWLEIRRVDDGRLVRLWRGPQRPSRVVWLPTGRSLSWAVETGGKTSIHVFDLASGETQIAVADVAEMGSWAWTPDAGSVIYEVNRKPDEDKRKVKRVAHPQDRQPWWRGRSHLMQAFVPGGITRRLTAGPLSPGSWCLSPDGRQLLFFLSEPDLLNRPFSTTELWLLDMETLAAEMVLDEPWLSGAEWSPDGAKLCLRGSPSMFDGMGRDLPEGVQANDYGGQLYLYDLAAGRAEPLTLDLEPDVGSFSWSRHDGYIYAVVTETQYSNVYRLRPGRGSWQRIDTGIEYTDRFVTAAEAPVAVAHGTGGTTPNRVQIVDLKKNSPRLLLDPGADDYADIEFGRVETYVATLPDGEQLDGFVYYPPDFDPERSYPLIVYYYGGTSPVDRSFGGRYPKNVWAGQGYVVYVPNPSGATGYGQEFAARHVNDWGRLTGDEVIESTKAFLADHPFADPDHVGCIGASYGGFLTQYVVTRTDLFAAAVSHAGISSISSYWGEGLWGYAYGARALADAFPWRDRDLYVEQSPLFHADRITTPLLLVHGDSDTNVPVGESDQLFTALKILGRPVEYVQIQGQDHHILDHDQRIVWNDTILAFFARYLKEREAWWDELYPEPEDY